MSSNPDPAKPTSSRRTTYFVVLVVAVAVAVGLVFSGTGAFKTSTSTATTLSTSYSVTASSVITAASKTPLGEAYTHRGVETMKVDVPGVQSAGYMMFSNYGGATANMTVMVFDSTASAQKYVDGAVSAAKDLSGYSNANSTLTPYEEYGVCYGYGLSYPSGIGGTAIGLCTKGNVFIQVNFTASSLEQAESGMSYLMSAAYQATV